MPQILDYKLEGNEDSQQLIVFLQGFPDNWEMWDWINWKEKLKDYRILFVNFPNTGDKMTHKWGVDFPQLVQSIKFTFESIEGLEKIQRKILVAHDWGYFYGYLFDQKYPKYFNQIITMDVPPYF